MDIKANARTDLPRLARKVAAALVAGKPGMRASVMVTVTCFRDDGTEIVYELLPEVMEMEIPRDCIDVTKEGDMLPSYDPGPWGFYLVAACRPGAIPEPVVRTVTPPPAKKASA